MNSTTSPENEPRPGQREYQGALTQIQGLLADMAKRVAALQTEAPTGRADGSYTNWGHTGSAQAAFAALEQAARLIGTPGVEEA